MTNEQDTALGVVLDTEAAFNNTSGDSMCAAVFKHEIDYTILQWIRATREGRLAAATLSGFSKRVAVSRGYLQAGVLSPFLWCLVDDLITRLIGGWNICSRLCG